MLILKKIMWLCKFLWGFVLVEDKFEFKCQPEFFYRKIPAASHPSTYTCLSYKHTEVKNLIHSFKYNKNQQALNICADFLAEKILEVSKQTNLQNYVLIPIPRSKIRLKKYGFDQCKILCQKILTKPEIKNLDLNYIPNILIHQKYFESQTKSNRRQRISNSKNTFFVRNESKIQGQKIILIDDVWTTGATLSDASRALKECGIKEIMCFTIAH
jgi:competence protein ComFC